MLILVLAQPVTVLGQTNEESATATATVETMASTEQTATATDVATEVVTPTETVVATETATAPASSTDVPTATESPMPSPTETPTQPSETGTGTATPASTQPAIATQTAIPTATPDATPSRLLKTSQSSSTFAIAAAGSCSQVAPGTGNYVTFECSESDTPFQIRSSLPTGSDWAYSFGSIVTPSTWIPGTSSPSPMTSSSNATTFYVYIRPNSAQAGGSVTLTLDVRKPNGNALATHTLTAASPVTSSNFQLSCDQDSLTVATSATGSVACTLSSDTIAPSATVTVTNVAVTAPAGWTVTRSPANGSLTRTASFKFTLSLTPLCGAAVNPPAPNVTISSQLTFMSSSFPGPSTSITAKHGATSNVSASITGSSLQWSRTYSFAPQAVSGTMTYQIVASGCAGWNIQVSATALNYSGTAAGAPIANSSISVSPGAPTAVSGSTANVSPGVPGTLGGPVKVLSATANSGIGTYSQTIGIGIAIPGAARVGTYTSTITIAAASGP